MPGRMDERLIGLLTATEKTANACNSSGAARNLEAMLFNLLDCGVMFIMARVPTV